MLLYFITFVHIIVGMVYFALPMVFPRWWRAAVIHPDVLQVSAAKMLLYTRLHLNGTAAVSLLSGVWMVILLGVRDHAWLGVVVVLWLLSLININAILAPTLKRFAAKDQIVDLEELAPFRRRMTLFAATHHTLVTLLVALMVFRPYLSGLMA